MSYAGLGFGGNLFQNSTTYPLRFFMADATDGWTGELGLTPAVTLSKNGAAFAAPAGAVSEIANGWYQVAGNATDLNTLGDLILRATDASSRTVNIKFFVSAIDLRDGVRIGLTSLPNAVAEAAGGLITRGTGTGQLEVTSGTVKPTDASITSAKFGAAAIDAAAIAPDAIGASEFAQAAADKVWATTIKRLSTAGILDIWDQLLTGILAAGSIGLKLKNFVLGTDNRVLISADAHTSGVTAAAVTAGVTVTTNNDKTNYALSAAGLTAVENIIWNAATSAHIVAGTFGLKLGSISDPWTTALPGAYTAGQAGKIVGDNINATISSRSILASSDIQTAVDNRLDATSVELTSVPAATSSMRNRITFLFEYFKNKKTVINNNETLFKDDSSTTLGTAAVSNDGTTFTKGKMS